MRNAEIRRFSDQSSVKFRRLAGDRVQVSARFVYKKARYEVDGVIDMQKRRVEPFRHRLTLSGQHVLDSVMSIGQNVVRTEVSFGNVDAMLRVDSLLNIAGVMLLGCVFWYLGSFGRTKHVHEVLP